MSKKTPMESQYDSIKKNHMDKILLFRLGDFYEVFNEDALETAKILNIALTKRSDRPMCGFPYHSLEQYAYKLVESGCKVAICEQVEDISQAKGIVKRDVVSILTKGTWSENPLLDRSVNSFLAIVVYTDQELSIVFADISTGDIIIRSSQEMNPVAFLSDELMRYMPVETLCMHEFFYNFSIKEELKTHQETLRVLVKDYFLENNLFKLYIKANNINPMDFSDSQLLSLKGLFTYLEENHFAEDSIKHLRTPIQFKTMDTMFMNEDTLKHLEIVYNAKDFSMKGTLFSILNKSKTMPAARKLRRLLVAPSAQLSDILRQQARTEYFMNLAGGCGSIQDILKGMSDLERLSARLITGKILPRECLALVDTIERSEKVKNFLKSAVPFNDYMATLTPLEDFCFLIYSMINPECSNLIDGHVIRSGVNIELDSYKDILENGNKYLIQLQAEERINTGINTLKISFNKIFGYYIEISKVASKNAPEHYIRKQSLVNAERFSIPVLDEFEKKISKAREAVLRLEREIYENFVASMQIYYAKLIPLSEFITEVDLRSSLAIVAKNNRYCKPILNDAFDWDIKEGRHPVIEKLLVKETFVANDTNINKNSRISIVTGPNMAGKSTYLRQNALFAVMAQIGSYLPVESATMGIVDQIFTRIGASDDLGAGRSTFFVEMQEAAMIIDKISPRSLVIMDELGRGTSTLDGLSLAWAILEHLLLHPHKQGKVLFSTHYHELTEIARFNCVKNLCMAIKENKGKPIFLRKVIEGKASKSYGIHVAEMAGIDPNVIRRSTDILLQLEQGTFFNTKQTKTDDDNNLFSKDDIYTIQKDKMFEFISSIDPNSLTPLDALRIIFELKSIERSK
ncbi:MAG: DNA mismatch repair protein MutS [Spirochaetota bacterium]|nr:DNA mismatch repair protein MutS [Spirochaetota bacterium]